VPLCSALLVLVLGGLFSHRQSIWVDETTQLNGIGLGPLRVLSWLLGDVSYVNGVPADRNPPLSFLLGQLWGAVFGTGTQSLRWMGVAAVACAAALLSRTLSKCAGWLATAVGIATFALVPQILAIAAEIRPYPLMLLFATAAWASFIAILANEGRSTLRHWLAFGAMCVLASYTHFYGLLMTGGLLCGLLVDFGHRRASMMPIAIVALFLALSCIGTVPFALQAAHMSHGSHPIESLGVLERSTRLLVRMFVSPSVAISTTATLSLLGLGAVLWAAGLRATEDRRMVRSIAVALALPFALCVVAAWATPAFDPLAPHYSVWMLPGVSIAMAYGARGLSRIRSSVARAAVTCIFLLNGYGCYRVIAGDQFTHGPHNAIMRELSATRLARTAIIVDETPEWAFVYFPLRHDLGPNPPVFLASDNENGDFLRRVEPEGSVPFESLESYSYLLLLHAKSLHTKDIAVSIASDTIALPNSSLLKRFRQNPGWHEVSSFRHISFLGARGSLFQKIGL
jgi:Dolichyl-phosphate-mannose-protein mannosyltransferase